MLGTLICLQHSIYLTINLPISWLDYELINVNCHSNEYSALANEYSVLVLY